MRNGRTSCGILIFCSKNAMGQFQLHWPKYIKWPDVGQRASFFFLFLTELQLHILLVSGVQYNDLTIMYITKCLPQ